MTLTFVIDDSLAARQFKITPGLVSTGGAVHVAAHSDIGVFDILDASDSRLGLLIGFPIDLQERCVVSGPLHLEREILSEVDTAAELILDRLGGRFLLLLTVSSEVRIYPDCAAQVPCVYSAEKGVAGSTADAILTDEEYQTRFRHDLYKLLDVDNDGWFPGGLTAHVGVERLLPNHFLDLRDWSQRRYWPIGDVKRTETPERNIEEISEIIRVQIEALLKGPRKVAQALTAGHETRVMLACARPYLASIEFVTLEGDSPRADDTVISKRMARDLGLSHHMLPQVVADETAVENYMRRGGHCVGGPNRLIHPSLSSLRSNHVFVGGASGEIGRAFFWHSTDTSNMPLRGERLINRMGLPANYELETRLTKWCEALPTLDSLIALDLAYLEQRVAPWGGAQMFSDPSLIRYNPISTQRTVKLMLELPDDWKRQSMLTTELVRINWPELLSYPFNSQGVVKDLLRTLGRAAKRPQLIARKLRKMRR